MKPSSFHTDTSFSILYPSTRSMYQFSSSSKYADERPRSSMYKHLTCRQWKNSAAGCSKGDCIFSHHYTGTISPALPYTCWFWENSGCMHSQDDCLYAHFDVGVEPRAPRHFGYYDPALSGHNAAIAQVAAKNGFDVSDWDALSMLISSVRGADRFVGKIKRRLLLADRWDGPAAYKSDIYPDSWVPEQSASSILRLRTITQSLNLPVRALRSRREDVNAQELLIPSIRSTKAIEVIQPKITGPNRIPLGMRLSRKHGLSDNSRESIPSKVPKTEDIAMTGVSIVHNNIVIELSDSDEEPSDALVRSALTDQSTNIKKCTTTSSTSRKPPTRALTITTSESWNKAAQKAGGAAIKIRTARSLEKVRQNLQASIKFIQQDREGLSNRWEVDEALQRATAMETLTKLNEYFWRAEEALGGAIEAVSGLL